MKTDCENYSNCYGRKKSKYNKMSDRDKSRSINYKKHSVKYAGNYNSRYLEIQF